MASLPPAAKYQAGALIEGKYRLEHKLGEGGMGAVWAAHHVALDTAVAIKLIRSDSNRQELGPRMLQEARAAAKLGHPAIVRVFDVGQTADGDPFIVMELLEGESLRQLLEREHRLTGFEAVRLLLPIADALRAAHGKGIVHRDIKPDNVFLVSDQLGVQPKLVDFGIAKLAARELDSQLTRRGTVLGSPDYMAPEQARGEEDIDQRADIWSFCVLVYETVSGDAPFDGANYNALLRAIVEDAPISLTTRCSADAELWAILERGLAKERSARWQTMQELGEALARWSLERGLFEDVAGSAIEAKWARRTDPAFRQSRPSLGSIPGLAATMPEVVRSTPPSTATRVVAEAPTSVGPVVTTTGFRTKRRLVSAGLACVAALAVAARFLWPSAPPTPNNAAARAPSTLAPGPSASVPSTNAEPNAPAAAVPAASPVKKLDHEAPASTSSESASNRTRPRRPGASAPAATGARKAPAKPALDLLSPY